MGKTTVDLTDLAQKAKMELMPIFGLKNILSAGLLIFYKLSSDEQKKWISLANKPINPGITVEKIKLNDKLCTGQKQRKKRS